MKRILKWLGAGLAALGGRELGLMADVARSRFAYFTDAEIQALHAFLRTLGAAAADSEDPS